jgi:hypothetical protein
LPGKQGKAPVLLLSLWHPPSSAIKQPHNLQQ